MFVCMSGQCVRCYPRQWLRCGGSVVGSFVCGARGMLVCKVKEVSSILKFKEKHMIET